MRKGRSVVHKNLEDNYGAVIVANHEALAQVLDQVSVCYYYWDAKIIMVFGKVVSEEDKSAWIVMMGEMKSFLAA